MASGDLVFPKGFLWGAATAAHQVEGNNTGNDWWRAEHQRRLPYISGDACDSWNRWRDDVALLADLGLNAYRFSIEWARVEPEPGRYDAHAIGRYREMIETLQAAGIEPLVTLHHFTNPQWLADTSGWHTPDVVDRFAAYAGRMGRELRGLVTWWVTINEPGMVAMKAYLDGSWPPFRRLDVPGYARMLRHVAQGHAAARRALKASNGAAQVSMAFPIWPMEPMRAWNPVDCVSAAFLDWFWQGVILRRSARDLDWVGVNYYTRILIGWPPRSSAVADPHGGSGEISDFGWELYPDGLYAVLKRVGRLKKPVIITENGISDADDDQRPRYVVDHLSVAHRAIRDGVVDLRGYVHWSLMDNFEWAEGYTQRFGLAAVDFDDPAKTRTPRPSARVYGEIARANTLSADTLRRHGGPLDSSRHELSSARAP